MRIVSFLFVISLLMPAEGWAADTFKLDYISYSDPDVPTIDPIVVYDQRCLDLWRQALNRPEVDLQCRASATIAQAFQMGMPAVDSLIPDLRKRLTADDTTLPARFAVARTLIMLKDRESAATLFHRSQQGNQSLRQLVEPVLAEWNHEPMRALWTQRLSDRNVRRQDLILAMRGLAQVKDPQASPQLLALVHDRQQPLAVRLTAAEAVGRIQPTELEDDARRQLVQPETATRLCAIALLSEHGSTAARDMLAAMVNEPEPTVASKALACLRVIDPERALMFAELAMRHRDANVRREGIELYLGLPTPERISFVGRLLDDPHPRLRGHIRDVFLSLAREPQLQSPILDVSRAVLTEPSWRGQEQAVLVLATLNDQASATRFVELLQSPRDEVLVAAAWGLRKLAVPETAPAILAHVRSQTDRRKHESILALDAQIAHLCEAMGVLKYAPADALLQEYIPKSQIMGELSRPCAIWALGKIRENQPDEDVAKKLIARILDTSSIPIEIGEVRQMSAITLARMQATSGVDAIKHRMGQPTADRESLVYRWSIMQLTDENIPLPEAIQIQKGGWFLEPARIQEEKTYNPAE